LLKNYELQKFFMIQRKKFLWSLEFSINQVLLYGTEGANTAFENVAKFKYFGMISTTIKELCAD
jgi:hypothetical protein